MATILEKGEVFPEDSEIGRRTAYARVMNRPRYFRADSGRGVLLVHGFLGSPFEVSQLVIPLLEAGFSVLTPLLYGFGGDTGTANSHGRDDWKRSVDDGIHHLRRDCDEIALIGFSLGGGLVVDWLLQQTLSEEARAIRNAVLLAPYCMEYFVVGRFLQRIASHLVSRVRLATLHSLSRHRDLVVPMTNPEYYNSDLPLRAAGEILEFGRELQMTDTERKIQVPVYAIVSDCDGVVLSAPTQSWLHRHCTDLQLLRYKKHQMVRHQLLIPEGNPQLDRTLTGIVEFLGTR